MCIKMKILHLLGWTASTLTSEADISGISFIIRDAINTARNIFLRQTDTYSAAAIVITSLTGNANSYGLLSQIEQNYNTKLGASI